MTRTPGPPAGDRHAQQQTDGLSRRPLSRTPAMTSIPEVTSSVSGHMWLVAAEFGAA